jgi:hypothetical protein
MSGGQACQLDEPAPVEGRHQVEADRPRPRRVRQGCFRTQREHRRSARQLVCLLGTDRLEQLYQRRWVEEVHAHDVLGPPRGAGE